MTEPTYSFHGPFDHELWKFKSQAELLAAKAAALAEIANLEKLRAPNQKITPLADSYLEDEQAHIRNYWIPNLLTHCTHREADGESAIEQWNFNGNTIGKLNPKWHCVYCQATWPDGGHPHGDR